MTATQGFRIRSLQDTCSGLRGGKDARGRLGGGTLRGRARMGAPWRQWPAAYGKGERGLSPSGGRVRPGRRPRAGSVRRTVGQYGRAPEGKRRSLLWVAVGVASAPGSPAWRIDAAVPCAGA